MAIGGFIDFPHLSTGCSGVRSTESDDEVRPIDGKCLDHIGSLIATPLVDTTSRTVDLEI